MLPENFKTRAIRFAFLFGPPKFVERSEASKVYEAVCKELGFDDFNFQYGGQDPAKATGAATTARGFQIRLLRREGRGHLSVEIKNENVTQSPTHLLLVHEWPLTSLDLIKNHFDAASAAVFDALPGPYQKVHAEVRIHGQCPARGGNALAYIQRELLQVPTPWVEEFGSPATMASMKLEFAATFPTEGPLDKPRRELTIEVLNEDPKSLYIEFMSQWPQLPQVPAGAASGGVISSDMVRQISEPPSSYLAEADAFLQSRLSSLAAKQKRSP